MPATPSEFELCSSETHDIQHPPSYCPGILEGDEDQVEPLQPDTIELRIELVGQLLLQLTVILLRIYLGQEEALRAGEARTEEARFSPRALPGSSPSSLEQLNADSSVPPLPLDLGTLGAQRVNGCFRPG